MALPMGLCPDSKRSLNFYIFNKKNQNPTMLDKGGITLCSTNSGCSHSIEGHKVSKFSAYFPQAGSLHSRSKLIPACDSFLVGGFLGSKSQGRSAISHQSMGEFLWDFFGAAAAECMNFSFGSVSSPPKKKCVKEVSNTAEFPSVIDERSSIENKVDGLKQSYAEVAKAVSLKPVKADSCSPLEAGKQASVRRGNRRKSQSGDHRGSRRRSNRRINREGDLQPASGSDCFSSPIPVPQPDWKDLRLSQKEKHFSHIRAGSHRNLRSQDRNSNPQTSLPRRDHQQTDRNPEGQSRSKRRSSYRSHSHCDNKRGTPAKKFDCDIDKINWRTGEPIYDSMGSQCLSEMECEDYPADQSFNESFTSVQKTDDCAGEQRMRECTPPHASPWPEMEVATPRSRRRSLSSECSVDSEDSFIIFQTGAPSDDSLSDVDCDYSDSELDDSYDSDSASSDEDDSCDALSPYSLRLKEVNDLWLTKYSPVDSEQLEEKSDGHKKVHFSSAKPTVHKMLAWDFAYRSSRLGPWEQMVRDRERFKTRIRQFECILSPVLTSEHRNKIWRRLNQDM
ncbi:hypothetical protein ONE63_007464 [Megalurothrips usitatus]|uniref:Protein phosphatase 1 regulatory subunit 15A/B C-terminal domain-containing protein n=1 Tax=Megalurothrips usitatus TaxID=439358 RepID=A0AAV7XRX6_9NEOP|nr:hypothetical protein ONE63_007464 [Megalurothrips usitatus]